jgi:hypothetical protein
LIAGLIIHFTLWIFIRLFSNLTRTPVDDALPTYLKTPSLFLVPLLVLHLAAPALKAKVPEPYFSAAAKILSSVLIALTAWIIIRMSNVLEKAVLARYGITSADNLTARRIYTQFQIFRKVISFAVIVIAAGLILMSFERFQKVGTGILASAGVVGVILGFAAQKTLGNLVAGIQIAVSQPIRLDDVVVVENEWGVIEDITLTYVVIKIWDLRRLIVPIGYFLEKPFQNWTRTSSKVLGTVFLYLDYRVPLDRLRRKLKSIVEKSAAWDGDLHNIVVTNCDPRCIEVRALVSAANASLCFDLRCEVREKLLTFIRDEYPESLPTVRAELEPFVKPARKRE